MDSWKQHRHLVGTTIGAVVPWIALVLVHRDTLPGIFSGAGLLWLAMGIAYTHVFEYAYHRWIMHRGIPLLRRIQRKHLDHHRIFYGDHFATRDPSALAKITGLWFLFPAALVFHYVKLRLLFAPGEVLSFLAGVVLHHVTFEVTHYFAHVSENGFDRLVRRVPVLRGIRDVQLRHHRRHHETPDVDFNFNPPFAVDVALRTFCVGRLWIRRCGPCRRPLLQDPGSAPPLASGSS